MRRWLALAGWIGLSLAAGGLGSIASTGSASFYANLVRPSWAPPSWVFGPAWTLLYLLMGTAAWLVWRVHDAAPDTRQARHRGLVLFVLQLALNALWTWLFFEWRLGGWAMLEIVVLFLTVAVTTRLFARVDRRAAWLLAPYLAWLAYAGALTWFIWRNNPAVL